MGKVFSPGEIVHDRVPLPGAHAQAANELLERLRNDDLPRAHNRGLSHLSGALLYGSVTEGRANRRSDIDIVISYDLAHDNPALIVEGFRSLFQVVERQWHTPVEATIASTERLRRGQHTLDPLFYEMLRTVPDDWVIGRNPVHDANPELTSMTWWEAFWAYAAHKERKFGKALSNTDVDQHFDVKVLQRAHELPSALGRKVLLMLAKHRMIEDKAFTGMAKKQLIAELAAIIDDPEVREPLAYLVAGNAAYSELLEATIAREVSTAEYTEELTTSYRPHLRAALNFTLAVGDAVQRLADPGSI